MNKAIMSEISDDEFMASRVYMGLVKQWPQINDTTRVVHCPKRELVIEPCGDRIFIDSFHWSDGSLPGDYFTIWCAYYPAVDVFLVWDKAADLQQVAAALRPTRGLKAPRE